MAQLNLKSFLVQDVPTVNPEDVFSNRESLLLIDVRREDEYHGELGHVEGAKLFTLGPDLTDFLKSTDTNQEVVFLCRSGARSAHATQESQALGFKKSYNMSGGMIAWNEKKLPIAK